MAESQGNGEHNAASNEGSNSNSMGDTTGLRRRRGRRESEGDDNQPQRRESSSRRQSNTTAASPNTDRQHYNNNNRSDYGNYMPPRPPLTIGGGHFQSAAVGVGNCGNGATLTSNATTATTGFGSSTQLTPYKTPTKESAIGLIAATPSSVTTAGETVESTVFSSPQSVARRNNQLAEMSLRRQYQLLQSQIILLLGSTSIGLVLFLLFALPFAAVASLAIMAASMAALVPVASSALQTRYQIEMEHPFGFLRYLPNSLRRMLLETSLHEFMTDTTAYMENRYLLLYFVPGLTPDQLMAYINRLPARHRNALLQPGLGSLMPSVMGRLMRLDNNHNGGGSNVGSLPAIDEGVRGDMSTSSQLTMDRDDTDSNREDSEMEVTLMEAITSLRQTLVRCSGNDDATTTHDDVSVTLHAGNQFSSPLPGPELLGDSRRADSSPLVRGNGKNANTEHENVQGDDNTAQITGEGEDNESTTAPNQPLRGVVVEMPQSTNTDEEQRELQREYDLEGRILSEAASAAVSNYSSQATAAVIEGSVEAVEVASSWVIRIGSFTGLLAGGGGIALATIGNVGGSSSLVVTLGSLVGVGTHRTESSDGQIANRQSESLSQMVRGLLASSAVGFLGAGLAFVVRNRARASVGTNRAKKSTGSLKDESGKSESKR